MVDNGVQILLSDSVENVVHILTVWNATFRKLGRHVVHDLLVLLDFEPDLLDRQFIVEWHISPLHLRQLE